MQFIKSRKKKEKTEGKLAAPSEEMLVMVGAKTGSRDAIVTACSVGVMLFCVCVTMLFAAGQKEFWVYCIPGCVLVPVLTMLKQRTTQRHKIDLENQMDSRGPARGKWIGIGAALIIFAAAFALYHTQITDGLKLIMNELYKIGEEQQAYIYERFTIEWNRQDYALCKAMGVTWIVWGIGTLLSIFPSEFTGWIGAGLFVAATILLSYYGILPVAATAFALGAAIILLMARTSLGGMIPLLVCCALIFGAVVMINPGESKTISRANENIRDKVALKTARLEGDNASTGSATTDKQKQKNHSKKKEDTTKDFGINKKMLIVLGLILLTLLILFVPAVIHDRLEKKRRKIRGEIDSADPAVAIRAMFPYTVRWLQVIGTGQGNLLFGSYAQEAKGEISSEYSERYAGMLALWNEAAFSSHEFSAEQRDEMKAFMDETIEIIKGKIGFKEKLDIRFRLAL